MPLGKVKVILNWSPEIWTGADTDRLVNGCDKSGVCSTPKLKSVSRSRFSTSEKHIAPIDGGGVALAPIQGLNQKLEEKEKTIEGKATEIMDLKARLEKIEKALTTSH